MGRPRSITPQRVREIRYLVAAGRSQAQVAGRYGITQATVSRIATGQMYRDDGGPIGAYAPTGAWTAEAVADLGGVTDPQLAERLGVSAKAAAKKRRKMGVAAAPIERRAGTKLTQAQVEAIRRRRAESAAKLAAEYDVHPTTIARIRTGERAKERRDIPPRSRRR